MLVVVRLIRLAITHQSEGNLRVAGKFWDCYLVTDCPSFVIGVGAFPTTTLARFDLYLVHANPSYASLFAPPLMLIQITALLSFYTELRVSTIAQWPMPNKATVPRNSSLHGKNPAVPSITLKHPFAGCGRSGSIRSRQMMLSRGSNPCIYLAIFYWLRFKLGCLRSHHPWV